LFVQTVIFFAICEMERNGFVHVYTKKIPYDLYGILVGIRGFVGSDPNASVKVERANLFA